MEDGEKEEARMGQQKQLGENKNREKTGFCTFLSLCSSWAPWKSGAMMTGDGWQEKSGHDVVRQEQRLVLARLPIPGEPGDGAPSCGENETFLNYEVGLPMHKDGQG